MISYPFFSLFVFVNCFFSTGPVFLSSLSCLFLLSYFLHCLPLCSLSMINSLSLPCSLLKTNFVLTHTHILSLPFPSPSFLPSLLSVVGSVLFYTWHPQHDSLLSRVKTISLCLLHARSERSLPSRPAFFSNPLKSGCMDGYGDLWASFPFSFFHFNFKQVPSLRNNWRTNKPVCFGALS